MQTSDKIDVDKAAIDPASVGWADRPQVRQGIRYGLYVVCALLLLADFVVHRHTVIALEALPAFYVIYGFIALVTVIQLSKLLRRVVGRKEDFYNPVKEAVEDDDES